MRRELRGYNLFTLEEALKDLGYKGGSYHTGFPSAFDYWRKDSFHVKLTEKPGRVTLHIHRDPKYHIGRIQLKGEDLKDEVHAIIKTCKTKKQPATKRDTK